MDFPTTQELQDLLSALLDGTLPPERHERLRDLLRQHPQARDLYVTYFALHAGLSSEGGRSIYRGRSLEATSQEMKRQRSGGASEQ